MKSAIQYLKDVPKGSFLSSRECVVIEREVFERLSDYTRSSPTGASVGRVWKKDLHWSGPPSNWFVYICDVDPNDGRKFYYGRPALLV